MQYEYGIYALILFILNSLRINKIIKIKCTVKMYNSQKFSLLQVMTFFVDFFILLKKNYTKEEDVGLVLE